jgi:hypothetical protein
MRVRKRAGVAARARSKRRERAPSWRREQALGQRAREELRHAGAAVCRLGEPGAQLPAVCEVQGQR